MKRIFLVFVSVTLLFLIAGGQSFYQLNFKNINGDAIPASSFAAKKVLFIILPLHPVDSNFSQLKAFKKRYGDSVQVVGVLSFEDGFQSGNASVIKNLYSNMGIILTEGMYTKKTSGNNQSPLMKWLTDKNKNMHFDMDAKGIGQKFFVSQVGRLYAVISPQTSLASPIIEKIVHSQGQ